jgi:phage protein D
MSGFLDRSVRQPRLRVLANGTEVAGAIDASVTSNNHYAADCFRVTLAPIPVALAATADITLEVQFSLDGGASFTSLVQGAVDMLDLDPVQGTLTLIGRDLTAALIETRTQDTFANQTSSEIATTLAGRHGLAANVTATSTPVGRYWELEHDRLVLNDFSRATTEWDLLVTLAQHEGFDVWISGTTLNFQPPQPSNAPQAVLRPTATETGPVNVVSLRLERSLTLAGAVQVTVKSWHSRMGSACVQSASSAGASGQAGTPLSYVYVVPNLTADQALNLAQQRLATLTQHERVVSAEMPGELSLAPRMMLRLEGTGTDFDQSYWIDEIERRLSVGHGFTQRLRAKNSSPTSQG